MMWVDTTTRPPNVKAVTAQLSTTLKTALPLSDEGVNVKCLIILRREREPVPQMQQLVLHPNS